MNGLTFCLEDALKPLKEQCCSFQGTPVQVHPGERAVKSSQKPPGDLLLVSKTPGDS